MIAAGLLWLLVSLTSPPDPVRPSVPVPPDRTASTHRLPLPDSVEDDPCFSRRIEGRVLCAGKGVAARVTLQEFQRFPGRPLREDRADAAGFFAFAGVPPGSHELCAIGPTGLRLNQRT